MAESLGSHVLTNDVSRKPPKSYLCTPRIHYRNLLVNCSPLSLFSQSPGKDSITFLTSGTWEVVKILAFKKEAETV